MKGAAIAGLLAAAAWIASTPVMGQAPGQGQAANLTHAEQGTRVTITYDLVSADPNALFVVSLQVRVHDTGRLIAVSPASVTGDGAGSNLHPGTGKHIAWNAGLDVETPQFDLYDFSLVIDRVVTGAILVESVPAGAKVTLDDETQPRGVTSLTIEGVTPGAHRVELTKDGYLPNRLDVTVEIGKTALANRSLTQIAGPTAIPGGAGPGRGGTVAPPKGGGIPKWIIPVVGGGAAAALLALKGKGGTATNGGTTTACTFTLSPQGVSPAKQSGDSLPVTVNISPPGCSPQTWTAAPGPNSAFVHVSPSSGSGGLQPVTVTYDANTPDLGIASRSGTAIIAGQTFAISSQPNVVTIPGSTQASIADGNPTFAAVSGVNLVNGEKVTIQAQGGLSVPGIAGQVSPSGSGGTAGSLGRLPGSAANGLICGVNGQSGTVDLFFVGTTLTFTSLATGPLFCGMNATNTITGYTGVTGSWSLTITIGG